MPCVYFRVLATIAFAYMSLNAVGQDMPVLHYTKENGLPSNTIYEIYSDSKGFLWFCSDKGMARYNGLKWEIFTTFDGLPDNEILGVIEDHDNNLWMATCNGHLGYYKNDSFYTDRNTRFLKMRLKPSIITNLTLEKDSSITFCPSNQTKLINIKGSTCNVYELNGDALKLEIGSIGFIRKLAVDRFELMCQDKTLLVDTNGRLISKKVHSAHFYSKAQDQLYISSNKGVYSLDNKLIFPLAKGAFNAKSRFQVYFHNGNLFKITDFRLTINNIPFAEKGKISSITTDKNGNYWIGTLNDGVYLLSKNFNCIRTYENSYPKLAKYAYASKEGLLFCNSDNNLYRFADSRLTCFFDYEQYFDRKKEFYNPAYIILNNIYYNYFFSKILSINLKQTSRVVVKDLNLERFSTSIDNAKALLSDGHFTYIAFPTQIIKIDHVETQPLIEEITPKGNSERIFACGLDNSRQVWYSTADTVYRIINNKSIAQLPYNGIPFKWLRFFGNYLIGTTHQNRLVISNCVNNEIFIDSTVRQNCIWENAYALDSQHLLLTTNNLHRIITLHPSNGIPKFSIQALEDPFIPTQVEEIASNGITCYFLKNGAITSVPIKNLLQVSDPPEIFFTSVRTNKKAYNIHQEIKVPYKESKNISITFKVLSFNGRYVDYEYSLSTDSADTWRRLTGNEINLISPGTGNYMVKLRAKTQSSTYSRPIMLSLVVLSPFWLSLWFISLTALLAITTIFGIITYLLKKKQQRHDSKIMFLKSEYKALNALINPHFIFNSLNSIQNLINGNNRQAANEYLTTFAKLVRQNMHNVSKELIPLQQEIDLVCNYLNLEQLRFKKNLDFHIDIEKEVETTLISIPPLLVQPLVENAIKHGLFHKQSSNNFLRVRIYEQDSSLYIEVSDNGIGLNKAQQKAEQSHNSYGLENIRTRIEQLCIIHNTNISFDIRETQNDIGEVTGTIAVICIHTSGR